jgi:hypothetical protein
MELNLTVKYQHAKRSKTGSCRDWRIYSINGVELFKQKIPFYANIDAGCNGKWYYENEYILNGRLHQTRYDTKYVREHGFVRIGERKVTYPLSKKKLIEMGVPMDQKIELITK